MKEDKDIFLPHKKISYAPEGMVVSEACDTNWKRCRNKDGSIKLCRKRYK